MPLIPLKCPNCGGDLQVESEKDAAICSCCGNPFIVKDAIVNAYISYCITNNITNINNIDADYVNISIKEDYVIRSGVLVGYKGESQTVEIPDNVIEIGDEAFKGKKVTKVLIPNSVKRIGEDAFSDCTELKELHIPSSVEYLGNQTNGNLSLLFNDNSSIKKVNKWNVNILYIPDSISFIGPYDFGRCWNLEFVVISNSVKTIAKNAFFDCRHLNLVKLPDSPITIDKDAFKECSLGSTKKDPISSAIESLKQIGYNEEEIEPVLEVLKDVSCSEDELVRIALGMLTK